jgi:hypothetical protein
MNFTVDCAKGESVNAALDKGWDRSGRLFITIQGVCNESVTIHRDDVILMGAEPGDGLAVSTTSYYPLGVAGGQRVELRQLTLQGGGYGLLVSQGAAVTGESLRITDAQGGLSIWDGTVRLSHSVIENSAGANVGVGLGGTLFLSDSTVQGAKTYEGIQVAGGSVSLDRTIVQNNAGSGGAGLGIMQGHVRIANSTITNNGYHGIWLHGGGVSIADSVISNHTGHGIELSAGTAELGGTTIENNGWSGIQAMIGSRVIVGQGTMIRGNSQHGIWLKDTSVVSGFNPVGTQITANTQYGIFCDPVPAVAQIGPHYSGVGFILNSTHVFGNGQGQISCPGIVLP